jgi:hypothetical protein
MCSVFLLNRSMQQRVFSLSKDSTNDMLSEIGLALALALGFMAWWRSRAPGTFYDAGVYEMTPQTHRRYALAGLAFAAYFTIAAVLRNESIAIAGLGAYAVVAIFYGASFLRGASHEQ